MRHRPVRWWIPLLLCGTVVGTVVVRPGALAREGRAATRSGAGAARSGGVHAGTRGSGAQALAASRGRLPLAFERNAGQADAAIAFLTRGPGYELFFTAEGATWALARPSAPDTGAIAASLRTDDPHRLPGTPSPGATPDVHLVRMQVVGANPAVRIAGIDEQPGRAHYFRGSDPADWRTGISTFARLRYTQVYPGIDLVYYGRDGLLEYDFVVAPGVNPEVIALAFEGADAVALDASGDLVLETPAGRLVQRRPVVYQDIAGVRRPVQGEYVLRGGHRVGFAIGPYDRRETLVIDPVLAYSTFLGGSGGSYGDQAYGVAVDAHDNVYLTGKTTSAVFPLTGGGPANNDIFVVKLTPGGALAYAAVISGNGSDSGEGIAVDANGAAIVTGFTDSTNFPTLNPIHLDRSGRDAFLLKLDPDGVIAYSTYLGGSNSFDYGEAVAVDAAGNAYVTGTTLSSDFPVLGALQPVLQGQDAFVVKVDPAGNLLYGTYLGGTSKEAAESIVVDPATGSFVVTGWTTSTNFPRVLWSQAKQSGEDIFVSRFAPDGQSLVYSRYLGGNAHERPFAIADDGAGGVFVGGRTDSSNFPILSPIQGDQPGTDAFLTRLGPTGAVTFSTYVGGNGWERFLGLSQRDGVLYGTGQTFSTDFPAIDALQPVKWDASTADAFVIGLDIDSSSFVFSTYLGGLAHEEGRGVAALPGGNVFVAGWTESADFPTVRPMQHFKSNIGNAFVTRLAPLGVDEVSPPFVLSAGGDAITVTGQRFAPGVQVLVGGVPATDVAVVSDTTITATVPGVPAGNADVTIVAPDGGTGTLYDALLVLSGSGPVAHAGQDQSLESTGPPGTLVVLDGTASFDPDNDPVTYEWRDAQGQILGTSATIAARLPLGVHTITLTVSDGHADPGIDTVTVDIVDTTAPTVAVATPNGGEQIYTGTPMTIEWTASDVGSDLGSFDVYLSIDGGITYNPTPICAAVSGSLRSCTWASPGPATSKARIRVTARDQAGNASSDGSNANFKVIAGTAFVTMVTPNTNVNWGAGSTQQLKWQHNLGTAAYVRLELSLDNGATWGLINPAVRNSAGSNGVYNWTLPATLTSAARIRVSWTSGPVSDVTDAPFTIAAPFITVSGPSAGTNWGYDTSRTLTWTTNLGALDRVDVVLSTDGGATFPLSLAADRSATAKSATFATPALPFPTTTARARVVWTNAPSGLSAQGTNPGDFRIEPPFLTVTSPNGGNVWPIGTNRAITWSHNLGTLERVLVELSQDDGASYPILVLATTPSDGTQSVAVAPAWATTAGRIRITWITTPSLTDVSDASFTIQ